MSASTRGQAAMTFGGGRVQLDAEAPSPAPVALEVAMLGHCPGGADPRVLLGDAGMRGEVEGAGYGAELAALERSGASSDPLHGLPIPLRSLAQFRALFPDAGKPADYRSRLAGDYAWLPRAVADFFNPPSTRTTADAVPKKLWIINVDQGPAQEAFLPAEGDDWLDPGGNSAFTRALMLPEVGLLAMPDLERLQIPAQLAGIPRLRIDNPEPRFLPCDLEREDGIRERRSRTGEVFDAPPPRDFGRLLLPLLKALARHRPDMHLLMALPFDGELAGELPRVSGAALADVRQLQRGQWHDHLHRLQLIYPYLRSADTPLISACGVLAGAMASVSARKGHWRSSAGQSLPGYYKPHPLLSPPEVAALRDRIGVGVLRPVDTGVQLDDERLAGGVFGERAEYARSGEIARFLGWLRRELGRLGRDMVFRVSPGDPRPRMQLESFLTGLHVRGALRGRLPREAFRIRERSTEGRIEYDIELAPAFPVDRIRLRFNPDRLEVNHG